MTAPNNKPAKKTAQKAAKAPSTFDFNSLTVADGNVPQRSNGRAAGPNPFVAHLQDSMAVRTPRTSGGWVGKGKTVTVPKDVAKDVVNLLRYAANKLGIGVTITDIEDAKQTRPGNKIQIDFAAKSRKLKKPAAPTTPAAPAAPAA